MKNELDRIDLSEVEGMSDVIEFLKKFQDLGNQFEIDLDDTYLVVSRYLSDDEQKVYDMGYTEGYQEAKNRFCVVNKPTVEVGECHCEDFRNYAETESYKMFEYCPETESYKMFKYCPFCGLKNVDFIP